MPILKCKGVFFYQIWKWKNKRKTFQSLNTYKNTYIHPKLYNFCTPAKCFNHSCPKHYTLKPISNLIVILYSST